MSTQKANTFQKKGVFDIMLDLETLGNETSPVIVQLAAVAFDIKTGETFEEFNQLIDPSTSVKKGLKSTGSCVDWWLTQDKEVFLKVVAKAIETGKPLEEVLSAYANFIQDVLKSHNAYAVKVWGNGVDNAWLMDSYYACRLNVPYPFWDMNDVRSIVDLGKRFFNHDPKKTMPFVGKKHDAIDDCKHQIKYLVDIIKRTEQGK